MTTHSKTTRMNRLPRLSAKWTPSRAPVRLHAAIPSPSSHRTLPSAANANARSASPKPGLGPPTRHLHRARPHPRPHRLTQPHRPHTPDPERTPTGPWNRRPPRTTAGGTGATHTPTTGSPRSLRDQSAAPIGQHAHPMNDQGWTPRGRCCSGSAELFTEPRNLHPYRDFPFRCYINPATAKIRSDPPRGRYSAPEIGHFK
jgi:hypothetical protein